ncbi:hypothetical protein ACWIUD_04615 [Helicobacter sp. 23-1044]
MCERVVIYEGRENEVVVFRRICGRFCDFGAIRRIYYLVSRKSKITLDSN